MENPESVLIQFYSGRQSDSEGRMLDEIIAWDDELLEEVHDYIQWLFPLPERSAYNASAPVLDEKQIQELKDRDELRGNLRKSFFRILIFYGFHARENNGQLSIVRADTFGKKAANWLTPRNHNFLRITRILKCLTLLGLSTDAVAFFSALEDIYRDYGGIIGVETLRYWREAVYFA